MTRTGLFVLLAVLSQHPERAAAQDAISDHIGLIGLGYFTSDAPLGIRYYTGPGGGIELGVGFESESDVPIQLGGSTGTTSLTKWALEGALLRVLSSQTNMMLLLRPGLGIVREQKIVPDAPPARVATARGGASPADDARGAPADDARGAPAADARGAPAAETRDTETRVSASLMLAVELFMGKFGFPNLSFGGGTGVAFTSVSPAGGGDSQTRVSTFLARVSVVESASVGFRFYF